MRKLSELGIGMPIKLGRYSVNGEEAHDIIWIKVHNDNTFITKFIEDFRAFDGRERTNPNRNRRDYGNNDYTVSNISQFLNSTEHNWYFVQHSYDDMPTQDNTIDNTPYEDHAGFLHLFTDEEIDAIEYSKVITAVPEKGETIIEQKIFLPSYTNVSGENNSGVYEGEFWDYFQNKSRKATATTQAIDNTFLTDFTINYGDNWYYWLRSAQCVAHSGAWYVGSVGYLGDCDACRGVVGLRPALKLNPNILLSDDVDQDGCPILKFPEIEKIEFASEEFLNLLNI